MKIKIFPIVLITMPVLAFGATRDANSINAGSRIGMRLSSPTVAPAPKTVAISKSNAASQPVSGQTTNPVKINIAVADFDEKPAETIKTEVKEDAVEEIISAVLGPDECRAEYRDCMDEFCLLDESEGGRCSCSNNIKNSKSLIQEIQSIQSDAEKLYTEGVEREKLGAKAKFVKFGESENAKKSSRASGIDLVAWINGSTSQSLEADEDIGDNLYDMAAESCEFVLSQCDAKRAELEEKLYQREIVKDCKMFSTYLMEQKTMAESNKRTAQAAVRSATLDMLATTNKYNRGECLLAYRACIADKGGCGVNFENCLDAKLLSRRANACDNVLDQCLAVKSFVLEDWADESKMILADAAVYSDKHMRLTCLAQIQSCLEDGCSTSTNSACLTNVNVAAGVCPIITECEAKIPGIRSAINDKLGEMRTRFCQNDVDKCLQDKCGVNYTAPECVGKNTTDIIAMCPQDMFASCKNEPYYDTIVSAALLQMDYQMLQGCINYYSETLGRVCGADMNCLAKSDIVQSLQKLPKTEQGLTDLRSRVKAESKAAVANLFKQLDTEATIAACRSAQQPTGSGRRSLKDSVSVTARMIAEISAENRYLADLESRVSELSREQDVEEARNNCLTIYKVEKKPTDVEESAGYSYIRSVSFEPSLRNCHVCRMQRVCEIGGESEWTSALKGAAGGLTSGASMGTMINAGWGTAIGAGVGVLGMGALGYASGGKENFCQEIESCEDINM